MSSPVRIYRGEVVHTRTVTRRRSFGYPVYMLLIDLDEIERDGGSAFGGSRLFGVERRALVEFRRSDFFGDADRPLSACVRDLVEERCGVRPKGAIQLLANGRTLGRQFNPIAVYYLYGESGELSHVVADVTNIPWRESCQYVFAAGAGGEVDGQARKLMHVSPFLGMDYVYRLRADAPDRSLQVSVTSTRESVVEFSARLSLQYAGSGAGDLRRALARFPAMAITVVARIFWQALRIRLAGVPWHGRAATLEPSAGDGCR